VAASNAANGRVSGRGRRGPGRGQRPAADTAAAAAERALADLRLPAADRARGGGSGRQARRPPRPAPGLQASAAPFVPEAVDASSQHQAGRGTQRAGQARLQRQDGQHPGVNGPPDAALSDAQASAQRALGVAGRSRRRRQRPGRGGSSSGGTRSQAAGEAQPESAPLAEGSDSAAHTSDDEADENSCPICTERLEVRPIGYEMLKPLLLPAEKQRGPATCACVTASCWVSRPVARWQEVAVGQCNHEICGRCSLRQRLCYNNNRCPLCNTDLKEVSCVLYQAYSIICSI